MGRSGSSSDDEEALRAAADNRCDAGNQGNHKKNREYAHPHSGSEYAADDSTSR